MIISPIQFDVDALQSMIGGLSVLDIDHLSIQSKEQAKDFLKTYGYDTDNEDDLKKYWSYHRKAVTYIQDELLKPGEIIPVKLSDPSELGEITNLLVMASMKSSE